MDLPIRILGFDLRERYTEMGSGDAPTQYSVDENLWCSVAEEIPKGVHTGFQYLWSDLEQLRMFAASRKSRPELDTYVAISRLSPVNYRDDILWHAYEAKVNVQPDRIEMRPLFADKSWNMIGYDVADFFLMSGLHNCCLDHDQFAVNGTPLSKLLNSKGLFDSYGSASKFALLLNDVIPDHALFFPYALFLI